MYPDVSSLSSFELLFFNNEAAAFTFSFNTTKVKWMEANFQQFVDLLGKMLCGHQRKETSAIGLSSKSSKTNFCQPGADISLRARLIRSPSPHFLLTADDTVDTYGHLVITANLFWPEQKLSQSFSHSQDFTVLTCTDAELTKLNT